MNNQLLLLLDPLGGVQFAFTSLGSSTSATYSVTATGPEGETYALTLNGVSQGNMTESPAGTYTKSVTLNQLSNTIVAGGKTLTVAFTDIVTGMLANYLMAADGGQTLTDSLGLNNAVVGSTGSSATDDPTWNADGYYAFDGNDYFLLDLGSSKTIQAAEFVFYPSSWVSRTLFGLASAANAGILLSDITGSLTNERITISHDAANFSAYTNASAFASNTWYILQVFYSSGWKIYLNGALLSTSPDLATALVGQTWHIGKRGNPASFYFQGNMAYIRLYESGYDATRQANSKAWLYAHAKANKPTLFASLP